MPSNHIPVTQYCSLTVLQPPRSLSDSLSFSLPLLDSLSQIVCLREAIGRSTISRVSPSVWVCIMTGRCKCTFALPTPWERTTKESEVEWINDIHIHSVCVPHLLFSISECESVIVNHLDSLTPSMPIPPPPIHVILSNANVAACPFLPCHCSLFLSLSHELMRHTDANAAACPFSPCSAMEQWNSRILSDV